LGDLSAFRQIAQDTLVLVQANNLSQAKMRITDLETAWDDGQARLKPMNPDKWTALDGVIDTVLKTLRALQPNIAAFSLLTTHACTTNRLCRDSKTFTPTKKADG
jgi:hypothetical protein